MTSVCDEFIVRNPFFWKKVREKCHIVDFLFGFTESAVWNGRKYYNYIVHLPPISKTI